MLRVLSRRMRRRIFFLGALAAGAYASLSVLYPGGPGEDAEGFAYAAACLWGESSADFTSHQHVLTRQQAWDDAMASMVDVEGQGRCGGDYHAAKKLVVDELPGEARIRRVARRGTEDFVVVYSGWHIDFLHLRLARTYYGTHRDWTTRNVRRAFAAL